MPGKPPAPQLRASPQQLRPAPHENGADEQLANPAKELVELRGIEFSPLNQRPPGS